MAVPMPSQVPVGKGGYDSPKPGSARKHQRHDDAEPQVEREIKDANHQRDQDRRGQAEAVHREGRARQQYLDAREDERNADQMERNVAAVAMVSGVSRKLLGQRLHDGVPHPIHAAVNGRIAPGRFVSEMV